MSERLKTVTVGDLIKTLASHPFDTPVRVWLPGSTIALEPRSWSSEDYKCILLEGNVDPGSALGED